MKLYNFLYNIIVQCLFFCLLIKITKSQKLQYKYFNYTESNLGDQNASYHIADIKTYDDGTILVHIIRNESTQTDDCSKIRGMSLEQKLRIRLIFLNGTVKEIDPKLKLELDPINYCLLNSDNIEYKINKLNYLVMYLNDTIGNNSHKNLVNPITIYPLQKPFLLVTYVRMNNSSDPRTYEECGEVIDWNGTSTSNICFDSGSWSDSTIQLNANKKLGFIRSARNKTYGSSWNSWLWQHYSIDKHGNLTNTTNLINLPKISYKDSNMNYSLIAIVPTFENGYLAIFNYKNPYFSITSSIGLCTIPISYNQTRDNKKSVIFQTEQPINSVSCEETDSFIYCIVSIHFNNGTFNGTLYEQIQIYPSGIEFSTHEIYSDQRSLRAKMTSFGDFIFDFTEYNNADKNIYYNIYYYNSSASRLEPQNSFIITNYFSVNTVTQNNNFLLASPNKINNISWSLLTISLPNSNDYRYNNVFVNKTFPSINDIISPYTAFLNITFNQPVYLSASPSNITIYKASDNSIRQRISTTTHYFIKISSDGHSIIIKVITSTFNEYNEQYFVSMDNNFVKGANWSEPLRGIHDGIWILKTDKPDNRKSNSGDNPIAGLARLTQEASKRFSALQNNQSAYIDSLLNDIAKKVPINRSRLSSNNKIQKSNQDQILIPIRIGASNDYTEKTAVEVVFDLDSMILFKKMTTISSGVTNDLDESYGFQISWTIQSIWDEYKAQIIAVIVAVIMTYIMFSLLLHIQRYKLKSKWFEIINSSIYILEFTIPNFILSILFVIYYSKVIPVLYLPSALVLCVPLLINFCIIAVTIYKGVIDPIIGENFKEWIKKYRNLIAIFIILIITNFEYLEILKYIPNCTKSFDRHEKLEDIFEVAIKYGAFFDIVRNILQIILQVKVLCPSLLQFRFRFGILLGFTSFAYHV
ncbi:hypothetical protein F8M41_014108 [Gigaspora margarita]|uniref:Uncharacterized protein n=1 Tax=Gigaspora margarita TaxID=4874 RepID=A0A8H4ARU4_GIGMA|nr:hypothetical protein F8M41_014108 [Gigaspora margarita]